MKLNLKFNAPFSVAVGAGFGIIVLSGYLFGTNIAGETTTLGYLRDYLLRGAVVLSAVALLVGIGNLSRVHLKKIRTKDSSLYSFVLLLSLMITLGLGIWEIIRTYTDNSLTFDKTNWIFNYIQFPIETSLMAILTISLIYAVSRLLGRKMTVFSVIFVGTIFFVFLGTIPQLSDINALGLFRDFLVESLAVGGARGILLGVALGTIATGIRVLMGSDRPYGG
jgi:cytochrome bd-type quinol oxidase subunit 2